MNDLPEHEKEAERIRLEILRRMTGLERIMAAEKLRKTAWELKRVKVSNDHPDWTDEQVENKVKEIFIRAVT